MENEKLGQEPAFPELTTEYDGQCNVLPFQSKGMSKRFYAACNILPAVISSILSTEKGANALNNAIKEANITQSEFMVGMAYEYADELLKQESE